MHLNFSSFCAQYIFFPQRLTHKKDQKVALACSILTGIFLGGMLHLGALIGRTVALHLLKTKIYHQAQQIDFAGENLSADQVSLFKIILKINSLNPHRKTYQAMVELTTPEDLIENFLRNHPTFLANSTFIEALSQAGHLEKIAAALIKSGFKGAQVPLNLLTELYLVKNCSLSEFLERFELNENERFNLLKELVQHRNSPYLALQEQLDRFEAFNLSQQQRFELAIEFCRQWFRGYPNSKYLFKQFESYALTLEQSHELLKLCAQDEEFNLDTLLDFPYGEEQQWEILKIALSSYPSRINTMIHGNFSGELRYRALKNFLETEADFKIKRANLHQFLIEFNFDRKKWGFTKNQLYELNLIGVKKNILQPLALVNSELSEKQLRKITKKFINNELADEFMESFEELGLPKSLHYPLASQVCTQFSKHFRLIRFLLKFELTDEEKLKVVKKTIYLSPRHLSVTRFLDQDQRFRLGLQLVSNPAKLNAYGELGLHYHDKIHVLNYLETFDLTEKQLLKCRLHYLDENFSMETAYDELSLDQEIEALKKACFYQPSFNEFSLLNKHLLPEQRFTFVLDLIKQGSTNSRSAISKFDLTEDQRFVCLAFEYIRTSEVQDIFKHALYQKDFHEKGRFDLFQRLFLEDFAVHSNIEEFFKNEEERFKLAIAIFQVNPALVLAYSENFALNKQNLTFIDSLCILLEPHLIDLARLDYEQKDPDILLKKFPITAFLSNTPELLKPVLEKEIALYSYLQLLDLHAILQISFQDESSKFVQTLVKGIFTEILKTKFSAKLHAGLQEKDHTLRHKQIQWLLNFFSSLELKGVKFDQMIPEVEELLLHLLKFPEPSIRRKISLQLILQSKSDKNMTSFQELIRQVPLPPKKNAQTYLPHFLLAPLYSEHKEKIIPILHRFLKSPHWSYGPHQTTFIQFLYTLMYSSHINPKWENICPSFTSSQQLKLLELLIAEDYFISDQEKGKNSELKKKFKGVLKNLQRVTDLVKLGRVHLLPEIQSVADLDRLFLEIFKDFRLKERDLMHFDTTLKLFRNLDALFTYRAGLSTLSENERKLALNALDLFVSEVLTNTFLARRYEEDTQPHLAKVFENRNELKKKWIEGFKYEISANTPFKRHERDLFTYFKTKLIIDKHLGNEAERDYPYLFAVLANPQTLTDNLQRLKSQTDHPHNNHEFQFLALSLLEQKNPEDQKEIFKNLLKVCPPSEFHHDLEGLLNQKSLYQQDLALMSTDDPCDLLLLGTEVEESCQRVNGNPSLNRGLLGYLLNGYLQALVVKDGESGRILGRSVLRMMMDEETAQPILFQERYYGQSCYQEMIDNLAIERAQALGLTLTKKMPVYSENISEYQAKLYPHRLTALANRSPFEYVDAVGGIVEGGYQISEIYQVN